MVIINLDNKIVNDKALRMRKGIVADVKTADMANGEGVRTTIFEMLPIDAKIKKVDSNYIYFQWLGKGFYQGRYGKVKKYTVSHANHLVRIDRRNFSQEETLRAIKSKLSKQNAYLVGKVNLDEYNPTIKFKFKPSVMYGASGEITLNSFHRSNVNIGVQSLYDKSLEIIADKEAKKSGVTILSIDTFRNKGTVYYSDGNGIHVTKFRTFVSNVTHSISKEVSKFCRKNKAKLISYCNGDLLFRVNICYNGVSCTVIYRTRARSLKDAKVSFVGLTNSSKKKVVKKLVESDGFQFNSYTPATSEVSATNTGICWKPSLETYLKRRHTFLWKSYSSLGEVQVAKILDRLGVKYISQYRTKIEKETHIFDFVVFIENRVLVIEFNGKQHYANVGWSKENFPDRQRRDKVKELFSSGFGDGFLAIRYDDQDVRGTLLNFLKGGGYYQLEQ